MVTHSSPSSRSTQALLAKAVAGGVATALVPPSRIPTRVRRSVHLGLGLVTAAAVAHTLGRRDDVAQDDGPQDPLPTAARVGIAGGLGTLAALSSVAGMGLDMAAERALVTGGARHPRLWIGAASTVITAAWSWGERRAGGAGAPEGSAPVPA
jgi:hypothetical protein